MDKMELLNLQSSLQSEVQAKEQINKELSKVKTDQVATERWVFLQTLFIHFSFINFGWEAKDTQKSELNHCTGQEPNEDKEGSFSFRCERKPQRIFPEKKTTVS